MSLGTPVSDSHYTLQSSTLPSRVLTMGRRVPGRGDRWTQQERARKWWRICSAWLYVPLALGAVRLARVGRARLADPRVAAATDRVVP